MPSNNQLYTMRMIIMSGKFQNSQRQKLWKKIISEYNGFELFEKYKKINQKYQHQIRLESEVQLPQLRAVLEEILHAYSLYDQEIGYTQGMNYVVAALIDIFCDTFQSKAMMGSYVFTIFRTLFTERGHRGYFLDGFTELLLFQTKL
jgi:Rab-GTPase-TBC domain